MEGFSTFPKCPLNSRLCDGGEGNTRMINFLFLQGDGPEEWILKKLAETS